MVNDDSLHFISTVYDDVDISHSWALVRVNKGVGSGHPPKSQRIPGASTSLCMPWSGGQVRLLKPGSPGQYFRSPSIQNWTHDHRADRWMCCRLCCRSSTASSAHKIEREKGELCVVHYPCVLYMGFLFQNCFMLTPVHLDRHSRSCIHCVFVHVLLLRCIAFSDCMCLITWS